MYHKIKEDDKFDCALFDFVNQSKQNEPMKCNTYTRFYAKFLNLSFSSKDFWASKKEFLGIQIYNLEIKIWGYKFEKHLTTVG